MLSVVPKLSIILITNMHMDILSYNTQITCIVMKMTSNKQSWQFGNILLDVTTNIALYK